MPHPATDARVHLAEHPGRASAVTATLTGSGTELARALLSTHGFRQVDIRTMILVRIDHEEPHYADQAARDLRTEGIAVEIDPGLQEAVDTEWTWVNYPMHWLNREEIRGISNDAQKIHDDIAAGRLTIHLHAHDGWTIVAVGTYRDGQSVHLHGEDHLRVIASLYDTPAQAIADFQRLNADTVRPGPAPATGTEREAAELLSATNTAGAPPTNRIEKAPVPEQARTELVPAYAADPGDHEKLLASLLEEQNEWEKYRTWGDDTTIANHESLTLRALFDHGAQGRDTKWTLAAYETPVSERLWHATAAASTPVGIVHTMLNSAASDSAWGPAASVAEAITQATRPLADADWRQPIEGRYIRWEAPGEEAAGIQFDAFAAGQRPGSLMPTWTVWGGNAVHQPTWTLELSLRFPEPLLQDIAFELAEGGALRSVRPTPSDSPALRTTHPMPGVKPSPLAGPLPRQSR